MVRFPCSIGVRKNRQLGAKPQKVQVIDDLDIAISMPLMLLDKKRSQCLLRFDRGIVIAQWSRSAIGSLL
jgi:hypothetical protein